MSDKSGINIKTPLGELHTTSEEDSMEFKFSAYGIVDIDATLSSPKYENEKTVKNQALKSGKINYPETESTCLSADEAEIHLTTLNTFRIGQEGMSRILSDYRSDIIHLESRLSTMTTKSPGLICTDSLTYAANVRYGYKQRVVEQYRKYSEALREVRYFRAINNLSREARPAEVFNKSLGIFLIILFVEIIINGVMFMDANIKGLFGGWLMSTIISSVNVFAGAFVGYYCLRYTTTNSKNQRMLGILGATVISISVLCALLFIAHYRDASAGTPIDDGSGNLIYLTPTLIEALGMSINFKHWESMVFLVAGIIIYLVSVFKGYNLGDPFPEYGRLNEKVNQEKQNYDQLKSDLYDNVKNIVIGNKHKIYSRLDRYRLWIHAYNEIPKLVRDNLAIYQAWQYSVSLQYEAMLKRYREFNKAVRTSPAPGYFDKFDDLTPDHEFQDIQINQSLYDAANKHLSDMESHSSALVENFQAQIERQVSEFDEFFESVEKEVDEKLDKGADQSKSWYGSIRDVKKEELTTA